MKNDLLIKCVLIVLIALLTLSCAESNIKPNPIEAEGQRNVQFFDSSSFDRTLSKELKNQTKEVETVFLSDVTVDDIPERLDKWFYMAENYEGAIQLKPEGPYNERGFISETISLIVGAYDYLQKKALYRPVQDYNATIYYESGTGKLTRVVFTKKP